VPPALDLIDSNLKPTIMRKAAGISNALPQELVVTPSYRPYYTEENARTVQPIFDRLIVNTRSVFYSSESTGVAPSTLHSKLLYGINWLCENGDSVARLKYTDLRRVISFKRLPHGVNIIVNAQKQMLANLANVTPQAIASASLTDNWMDTFTKWLESAKELDQFDSLAQFGGVVEITPESESALVKLCAQLGCELDLKRSEGCFRVMR